MHLQSLAFYYIHQATTFLKKLPWPPQIMDSIHHLSLPYTINNNSHHHIHQIEERFARLKKLIGCNLSSFYHSSPSCILFIYFVLISLLGFLVLRVLKLKLPHEKPRNIDLFFMAVSAATVSSMSTVEMEVFSNSQLIVLTILMLIGGEVFTSLLGLQFKRSKLKQVSSMTQTRVNDFPHNGEIELESNTVVVPGFDSTELNRIETKSLKYNAIGYLSCIVLGYLVVIHVSGSIAIVVYINLVSSAKSVLQNKGLNKLTFSIFTTVSSFSNCGFIPTNENMIVFKKNLGLLLLIIPQCLLGGTMYPTALRSILWIMKKISKREVIECVFRERKEIGYAHLFNRVFSLMLAITVVGFLVVQLIALCVLEWRHDQVFGGLSSFGKLVNSLFLAVNTRHTGESTVDLSTITPAILVLFVFMMYLPPYTTFMPFDVERESARENNIEKRRVGLLNGALFSQLSCIVIFVMLICVTERDKLSQDPINFNVLSIVVEVVSAYRNVGYSIGYSCSKHLKPDGLCKDAWTGFAGRWSNTGKVILIGVMFLGRLRRPSMGSGNAWKLSYKNN